MHKTAVFITLITLSSILLFGCRQEEETVMRVTAVAQQPTATATVSPTISASPTIVVEETAVATATNIPELTPTILPIEDFETDVDYKLTQPALEALLNVVRRVNELEETYIRESNGRISFQHVNNFVKLDMENFHPAPVPHVEELLEDTSLTPNNLSWWTPSTIHYRFFGDAILQKLNQEQTELAAGKTIRQNDFILTPYRFDTGNDLLWLIQVESSAYEIRFFLLIEQKEDGRYEVIPSPLPIFTGRLYSDGWITDIMFDKELTGDNVSEIIIDSHSPGSGFSASEKVWDVYSWNGNELIELGQIRAPLYQDIQFEQSSDGFTEIQIINSYGDNFGCYWEQTDTYRWPNGIAQHTLPDKESPDTAVCNLSQSRHPYIFGFSYPNKEESYPILARAVSQLQEDEDTSPELLAYALSQLAFAHLEQGLNDQARETIDQIYNLPKQNSYAQYLQQHDVTGSVIDLCRNLNANAYQALQTEMGDYLNENATRGRGFVESEPNKAVICDLGYIASTWVEMANMPSSMTPSDALATLDLQLAFAHSTNLDDDPELEWVGILEPEAPWLVIFDVENGQWVTHFIEDIYYPASVIDMKIAQKFITNEVKPSFLTLLALSYSDPTDYEVLLIDKIDQEYDIVAENHAYGEEPNLEELDRAFFNLDNPEVAFPIWTRLEGFLQEKQYIGTYLATLTDSVITQSDPTISTKITDLLNYLPSDDPEAQPYREHLTYLLGYHYELSGDEEYAVSIYTDLIQHAPSSPWSWLAWSRLEPVE